MTIRRCRFWSLLTLGTLACQKAQPRPQKETAVPPGTAIQSLATDSLARSAAVFTQAFYDWYRVHDDRLKTALAEQPGVFDRELLAALRADVDAQDKSPGEVVGIDWDPFTESQDPCDPYRVDRVFRRGDTIVVAVIGTCTDARPRVGPDVLVRVRRTDSGWVFLDFREPTDSLSLLDHLALLRQDREADSSHARH